MSSDSHFLRDEILFKLDGKTQHGLESATQQLPPQAESMHY